MSGERRDGGGDRGREVAVSLMRMALALLDREGELLGAARLQHAIDTLDGEACHAIGGDLAERIDAAFASESTP